MSPFLIFWSLRLGLKLGQKSAEHSAYNANDYNLSTLLLTDNLS